MWSIIHRITQNYERFKYDFRTSHMTVFYPHMNRSHKCTVMLLFNLAEPDWISVHCRHKLLHHTLCFAQDYHTESKENNAQNTIDYSYCLSGDISTGNSCLSFIWSQKTHRTPYLNMKHKDPSTKGKSAKLADVDNFQHIFDGVSLEKQFPPLVLETDTGHIYSVKFERFISQLNYKYGMVSPSQASGFLVWHYKHLQIIIGTNLFSCTSGGYIIPEQVSDDVADCPNDNSDEQNCICYNTNQSAMSPQVCRQTFDGKEKPICSLFYYITHKGKCQHYTDSIKSTAERDQISKDVHHDNFASRNAQNFVCHNGKIINKMLLNDLIFDCGSEAEDEPILMSKLENRTLSLCTRPDSIPCMEGHSRCYDLRDVCSYKLSPYVLLIPCRNGGHLYNCQNFQCGKMFKCKEVYCIPWLYVCDSKWDCPDGNDEQNTPVCHNEKTCVHLYKCRNRAHVIKRSCIHLGNVCDGHEDCPLGDDELLCHLTGIQCAQNCACLLLAVVCENTSQKNVQSSVSKNHLSVSIFCSDISSLKCTR